jgi:hypothetical protein
MSFNCPEDFWHTIGTNGRMIQIQRHTLQTTCKLEVSMKAFYLAIPMLLAAFLFGCTEQSPLTGPATDNPNQTLTKPFDGIQIDEIAIAPNGTKFNVKGYIEYQYSVLSSDAGLLYTNVTLTIVQSGTDKHWTASGENKTFIDLDENGQGKLSQGYSLLTVTGRPSKEYGVAFEFGIHKQDVTIEEIEIQALAAAYVTVAD